MKIRLFSDPNLSPLGGPLFGNRVLPPHRRIRQAIRKQVMTEYELELEGATGWRRNLVKWKISTAIEIRFRQILFSGSYGRVVH